MRGAAVLVGVVVLLAGCGNARTPVPDVTSTAAPGQSRPAAFPRQGVRFLAPSAWRLVPGTAPLVATVVSGRAQIAIWRYPRSEPLPRTRAQLAAARTALLGAARQRDPTFRARATRIARIGGAPAVVVRGSETVAGQPRVVRSTHVYADGAEVVVDAFAPAALFPRVDRAVFAPLAASLRVGRAR